MLADLGKRLEARLPKSRIARRIITLASGTAMAQLVTICAMPVVTRLYTPAQIGVISLFLSFFVFWAATLSLRYEYALLIAQDDAESHVVHRLAVILVVVMSVLGMPVLWWLRHANVLSFGLLPAWAPLIAVPVLLGYGVFMVYRSWALRAGMVASVTKASIIRSVANAGARIVLGFLGGGVPALFIAEIAGAWAAMLKLMREVGAHFLPSRPVVISCGDLRQTSRKFGKFPVFDTPSAWVNQLGLTLPLPMVATLHGATAAGWFGLARLIVAVPNSQIGGAVADVFQMELANAVIAGDSAGARSLFYKLLRKLALIGLLPLIAVIVLGPWGVPWVFGHNWAEAGIATAVIAPWLYAALVVSPLSRSLSVLQAQEFKLIYDVCALLFLVVAFFISKLWGSSFIYTVSAISAAGLLSYVTYAAVLVVIVERYLKE